ncbi:MAG: SDR family oxidoreductase [Chloroflexi bacterium]|nr:SDR family oxidoreductase [Chloroflexota bacterium]
MKGLAGKVALVTGGASGIGRAAALLLAREGAKVVVADLSVEGGEESVRMVKASGGEAIFVRVDVSDSRQVEAMVGKAVSTFGRLDCAFNNAGVEQSLVPLADCPEEEWERIIRVNLKGVWLSMKYEIPRMLKQGGGSIVNTSSVAGLVGGPLNSAYVASKHGILGLTRAAALEYASARIRVNAVCPGITRTPMIDLLTGGNAGIEAVIIGMHPIGRAAHPDEIAAAAVWLCSDEASFVTGHALAVDGGFAAQ